MAATAQNHMEPLKSEGKKDEDFDEERKLWDARSFICEHVFVLKTQGGLAASPLGRASGCIVSSCEQVHAPRVGIPLTDQGLLSILCS